MSGNTRWLKFDDNQGVYRKGYMLNDQSYFDEGPTAIPLFPLNINAGPGNNPDVMAPNLTSVAFQSTTINVPGEMRIVFTIMDSGSSLNNYTGDIPICYVIEHVASGLQSKDCAPANYLGPGQYEVRRDVFTNLENGQYGLREARVGDLAGNTATYIAGSIPGVYLQDSGISVPIFTVTGGSDLTPPLIASVVMDQNTYDMIGGPAPASVTITASDTLGCPMSAYTSTKIWLFSRFRWAATHR